MAPVVNKSHTTQIKIKPKKVKTAGAPLLGLKKAKSNYTASTASFTNKTKDIKPKEAPVKSYRDLKTNLKLKKESDDSRVKIVRK